MNTFTALYDVIDTVVDG